jgi:hypothetical protein
LWLKLLSFDLSTEETVSSASAIAVTEAAEATTHHQLRFGKREVMVSNDPRLYPPTGQLQTKKAQEGINMQSSSIKRALSA